IPPLRFRAARSWRAGCPRSRQGVALFRFASRYNARHHPPRSPAKVDDKQRVRGRVHAVVRCRPPLQLRGPLDGSSLAKKKDSWRNVIPPTVTLTGTIMLFFLNAPSGTLKVTDRPGGISVTLIVSPRS